MESFVVDYQGHPVIFTKVDHGYAHRCPNGCCRSYHWIETESGARHQITSAPGTPVTIVGSLWCPCLQRGARCSWHVRITNGVAQDC